MTLFQEQSPFSLFSPRLPSSLGFTQIKAEADLSNRRATIITWPAQKGAVKYHLYVSPSPEFLKKVRDIDKTLTTTIFETPIVIPEDFVFYFNISFTTPGGKEQFIQDHPTFNLIDGAFDQDGSGRLSDAIKRDIIDGFDLKFFIEEIRRRHTAMNQINGEDFFLHIARLIGQPCVCRSKETLTKGRTIPMASGDYSDLGTKFDDSKVSEAEQQEAQDPEFHGTYRCPQCFGTGIAGGYLPKIKIRIRYGNLPKRKINFRNWGMEFTHNFNSWTLWHPRLKEYDVLVRIRDGERFFVKDVGNTSEGGIALHQEFNAASENRDAPIYQLTDDGIFKAIEEESVFDIAKFDWAAWL